MSKKTDCCRSILIVSSSEQFDQIIKRSLAGFITIDIKKSVAQARRCILEKDYDLVAVNIPLTDETGEEFAIDVSERSSSSILLVTPQDIFEDVLQRVTDHGILVVPRPFPAGRIDRAVRLLVAMQSRIYEAEKKVRAAEEKLEELRIVTRAKFVLIEKKHMSEDEAHRVIGKIAMDNGVSRGRAAKRILDEFE